MLNDTLIYWLVVINALCAARGIWVVTDSVKVEADARQLQAEADMLNARIADEKWERHKAGQARKETLECNSAELS